MRKYVAVLILLTVVGVGCGGSTKPSQPPNSAGATLPQAASAYDPSKLISWGIGAGTWERQLGISSFRVGCTDPPSKCVTDVESWAAPPRVSRIFYSMLGYDSTLGPTTADYASQYSQLSVGRPWLHEVGIDDFVDVYSAEGVDDPASVLDQMIRNLKSSNPNLKFGITLYEYELSSPYIRDPKLPSSLRAQVDYVHLYLTYRENGPRYATYVQQARDAFPHAQIIAGSYPYDRIDFVPCSQFVSGKKCTVEQEFSLFKKSLELQVRLLGDGSVEGIEFFSDDHFSYPETASSSACKPQRKRECVRNTEKMRSLARAELSVTAAPPEGG